MEETENLEATLRGAVLESMMLAARQVIPAHMGRLTGDKRAAGTQQTMGAAE